MADLIFYKCNKCKNRFESREALNFILIQYHCVKCDTKKRLKIKIAKRSDL